MTIPIDITDAEVSALQRALDAETRIREHLEIEMHPRFVDRPPPAMDEDDDIVDPDHFYSYSS